MTRVLGAELVFMSDKFNRGQCVIICNVPTSTYNGNPPCVDKVGVIDDISDSQYVIRVIGKAEIFQGVYYVISAKEENMQKYAKDLTLFSDIEKNVSHVEGDPDVVKQLMQSSRSTFCVK